MSAGELEHEWAGTPGRLIRERYKKVRAAVVPGQGAGILGRRPSPFACRVSMRRVVVAVAWWVGGLQAGEMSKVRGKFCCLIINDIDAGLGHFENTQVRAPAWLGVFGRLVPSGCVTRRGARVAVTRVLHAHTAAAASRR